MFTPEPPLKFPPADQAIADRLMKIVPEIDRLEGYAQPHAMAVARLARDTPVGCRSDGSKGSLLAWHRSLPGLHQVATELVWRLM